MNAGIIAAGWGRRLGGGPKALTSVAGRALIDYVLDGLAAAGVDEVTCIVNEASRDVPAYVARTGRHLSIDWIIQTTPSSMHSFLIVLERLARSGHSWHVMTTVDAICAPETVASFARRAALFRDADLVLGLTDVVDDEKPLHVSLQGADLADLASADVGEGLDRFRVRALGRDAAASPYVTTGLYRVSPSVLREKEAAAGFGALREFFAHVLTRGYGVYGLPIPPVVDVDRPDDVRAAEALLRESSLSSRAGS